MSYKAPTKEGINRAIEAGWSEDEAALGYTISSTEHSAFPHQSFLIIERIDEAFDGTDITNEDCARHAAETGCKIIPKEELPKHLPEDCYMFGFIDDAENRETLESMARHNFCHSIYMGMIRDFAEAQTESGTNSEIGFNFDGHHITNPWRDQSLECEFDTAYAFEKYGYTNMLAFIESVAERLGIDEAYAHDIGLGIDVATVFYYGDEPVRSVEILKVGKDLYKACIYDNTTDDICSITIIQGTSQSLESEIKRIFKDLASD